MARDLGRTGRQVSPPPPRVLHVLAEVGTLADPQQPVCDRRHAQDAYAVVAMTPSGRQLARRSPSVQDRLFLLRAFDPDAPQAAAVDDPFCGTLDDYRRCRDIIRKALPGLITYLNQTA